jgi:glycine/D-amino acid oxidase-like deaminating enzyme
VQHAFELPDRAIRQDVLLASLAACAQDNGVEIRTDTPARALLRRESRVQAVVTGSGEEIAAALVILAVGTGGQSGIAATRGGHRLVGSAQCGAR